MMTSGMAGGRALLQDVLALRRAGDTAGAIALVDRCLAGPEHGAGLSPDVECGLFRMAALDLSLDPALFRHLVDHFGWWDPAGRAARADPEAHAALLDRLAAEDWFATLQSAAHRPGDPAGIVLGRPAAPLDAAGKQAAREIIARLLHWGDILLDRLDGEDLAALREAVEGPPQPVSLPPPGKPFPTSRFAAFRHRIGWSGQACIVLLLGAVAWTILDTPGLLRRPPSEQEQARSILAGTPDNWVEFRRDAARTIVYFTQLTGWRAGLRAVRYGLDTEQPDRTLPLSPPGRDDPVGALVQAPATLRFVSVQVTWFDGTASPVRIFRVGRGG